MVYPSVLLSAVASVPRIESPGQRLESLGTPPLKLSDAEEENLEEAAALFSLLGVQVQVLGSSLLARRTAAVAATGPRGQLAAVLIRLTSDTGRVVLISLRTVSV